MNIFHSNIISIYGEKGKEWVEGLPELVVAISSRLDLRDLKKAKILPTAMCYTDSKFY